MATYHQSVKTVGNKNLVLKYFKAIPSEIGILGYQSKYDVKNTFSPQGSYGVNGSFFTIATGVLETIAINRQAFVKPNGGTWTIQGQGSTGYMIYTNKVINGKRIFMGHVSQATTFPSAVVEGSAVNLSDVTWGIGGFDLLLEDSSINITNFKTKMEAACNTSNMFDSHYSFYSSVGRTALGYNGTYVYVCAIFGDTLNSLNKKFYDYHLGANFWETREVLKQIGCTKGLMLDGGGSTQISYNYNNSNTYSAINDVGAYDSSGEIGTARKVPCFIKTNY
jgi:hypothetical protein